MQLLTPARATLVAWNSVHWAEDKEFNRFMASPAVKYPWDVGIQLPTASGGAAIVQLPDLVKNQDGKIEMPDGEKYNAGPYLFWEIQPPVLGSECMFRVLCQ